MNQSGKPDCPLLSRDAYLSKTSAVAMPYPLCNSCAESSLMPNRWFVFWSLHQVGSERQVVLCGGKGLGCQQKVLMLVPFAGVV